MGDQDTQTQHEPSWWAADASPEDLASSPSFDQPLEWPDVAAWEELFEGGPPTQAGYVPQDFGPSLTFPEPPSAGEDSDRDPPTQAHLQPLPDSIWADPSGEEHGDAAVVAATVAALGGAGAAVASPTPAAVAETDLGRRPGPAWLQRFQVRHGSAAIVALACCVSLVLLGMFLSVRARDDLPTQTSDFQPAGGEIATQASSSLPPTTTAPPTTASPPSTLSLSDLIPADAVADAGGSSGTTARTTAPVTTAAPSRSAAPSGGGGGTGSSAAQPTNTTAAPDPEPTTAPTSPPQQDTTTTPTTARRVLPTVPDFDYTIPSYTWPSFPSSSGMTQPGSSQRTNGN